MTTCFVCVPTMTCHECDCHFLNSHYRQTALTFFFCSFFLLLSSSLHLYNYLLLLVSLLLLPVISADPWPVISGLLDIKREGLPGPSSTLVITPRIVCYGGSVFLQTNQPRIRFAPSANIIVSRMSCPSHSRDGTIE